MLTIQAQGILATDFFHVDTLMRQPVHVLFVAEHATRCIHLLGVTVNPSGAWVAQQARDLLIGRGDRAAQFTFLIRDPDSTFTGVFDVVVASETSASCAHRCERPIRHPQAACRVDSGARMPIIGGERWRSIFIIVPGCATFPMMPE
ncbi:MAG: hypothetical protein LC775_12665 [Acidobacteria bacterium]|nr:hypothetical protein [Acidobacteriota bacterium]